MATTPSTIPITPDTILDLVASRFGLTREDLLGRCKSSRFTEARGIAMLLLRKRLRCSYPELGRLFGRDHSTTMAACSRISARIERDAQLSVIYDSLKKDVEGQTQETAPG